MRFVTVHSRNKEQQLTIKPFYSVSQIDQICEEVFTKFHIKY